MKTFQILVGVIVLLLATRASAQTHYPDPFRDDIDPHLALIGSDARNVVILIHGWNPPDPFRYGRVAENKYVEEQPWSDLRNGLFARLAGSDWKVVLYHWEQDAATGLLDFNPLNGALVQDAVKNGTEAANRAVLHGAFLADQLNRQAPNLRRVHFIAHSAGAWAARVAALSLLRTNHYLVVQITLCDAFIPGAIPFPWTPPGTPLVAGRINDLAWVPQNDRIFKLDHYYADDILTMGTDVTFSWRSGTDVLGQKTDYGTGLGCYNGHSGPISFIADSVVATTPPFNYPPCLQGLGIFDYSQRGWFVSLFQQSPLVPRITVHPQSQTSNSGASLGLNVTAISSQFISYQWFKDGQPIPGATSASYNFTASAATVGDYVVRVSNINGKLFSDKATISLTTPVAPTISYVTPTLPTSSTAHPITINGSNFKPLGDANASALIFRDPGGVTYVRTPASVTANQIQYYINVGSAVGLWSVIVTNAGQAASNLKNFSVEAPAPSSGSLTVNLSPTDAGAAGAQWRVDGGTYRNNGDVIVSISPGSHNVSFKPIAGYNTPPDQSVTVTANALATVNANYSANTPSTYTLTLNYDPTQGGASPLPLVPQSSSTYGSYRFGYTAGSSTLVQASASSGYHFTGWSGDASGSANPLTVTMNGNKNITANFAAGDPNLGILIVTIAPPEAAAAGIKWGWNANDYRDSGSSVTTDPISVFLTIHGVDGWIGPSQRLVTIRAGETTNAIVTFTPDPTPGLLTVTLSPPSITADARWHVNGGPAQGSGATISLPPAANYSVTFDAVPGWTAPPSQTVQVQRAQTAVVSGNYTPPPGQPVIAAIHPSSGALTGGTALTIEGVNFTAPATVLIGGKLASNITVLSASQIACLTPSNSVYGSQPVVVQTPGGSTTNLNGFTYGIERGNGIELVTAMGGRAYGVAVQGDYAYVGEGNSLLVVNISNQANPFLVGRLPLPGRVMDIALFGQYAYIADADAGLQVVDISNPAAPALKGFYPSSGWANGIVILGGRAYLAGGAGLEILDLANPIVPAFLSSTNFNGNADDVAVVVRTNGVFAYLSSGGYLAIIDVSQPLSPNLRGNTSIGDWTPSLAVSGYHVFAATAYTLKTLNVSNPDAPVSLGDTPVNLPGISGLVTALSVAAANGVIYAAGGYFFVLNHSGDNRTVQSWSRNIVSDGFNSVVSGNRLYLAGGTKGFQIVDVSNSSSPSLLAKFTDSDSFDDYYGVTTLSGNYLYTMGYAGLKVLDVNNPALPIQLWQNAALNGGSFRGQIIIKSGYAFVATGNYPAGISILNVNNPASPVVLPNYISRETVDPNKMAVAGNNLLVAGMDNSNIGKLVAFDVSTPSTPVQRGSLSFTPQSSYDPASSVAAIGTKAVVGMRSGALKVIDLSDINSLVELGQITNIGNPWDIALTADARYAYVIDGNVNSTLRIVDVSNSLSPSVVTNIPLGTAGGRRLVMRENLLYAVTSQQVFVFDVTNPTSPVLIRSYPFGGATSITFDPNSITQKDFMYLGSLDGGFAVLKNKDIEAPTIFITNPTFFPIYTNTSGTMNLGGSTSDNIGVTRITWANDRGGSGEAVATENWVVNGITLYPGTNNLIVTAFDLIGNSGNDTLTVIYQMPKQSQTITFPSLTSKTFGDAPITLAAAASSGLTVGFSILSGPATLTNNVLTLTGAGTVNARASQAGNDAFNAAPDVTNSFNVAKADQSISFALLPDKSVADAPFAVNATASSGLLVTFSIVSGPATVSSNIVTITGAGTVTVRASRSGDTNYNAALAVERSFAVGKLPQFITFGALHRQAFGDAPFALAATAGSGLLVSFSVLSGPAIVSGNLVTVTGAGLVVLRAAQAGDATYAPAPNADQVLIVVPGNNVISDFQPLANGMSTLRFYGEPGTNYVVQGSADLVTWLPLTTNQVSGLGYLEFTDTASTNLTRRFYRIGP